MLALQLALRPPYWPLQLQLQGPLPLTLLGVPLTHRLAWGATVRVWPWLLPQAPSMGSGPGGGVAVAEEEVVVGQRQC